MYPAEPFKSKFCNFVFKAPKDMDNCSDLHVFKANNLIISYWKIKGFWKRFHFLFTGHIRLAIHSNTMPPVSIEIECTKSSQG